MFLDLRSLQFYHNTEKCPFDYYLINLKINNEIVITEMKCYYKYITVFSLNNGAKIAQSFSRMEI